MKLHFISAGQVTMRGELPYSDLASTRYRVLIPAMELLNQKHEMEVFNTSLMGNEVPKQLFECDVLIFSKSFTALNAQIAREARKKGVRVVLDLCDNHFELNPDIRSHVIEMVNLSDALVASTPAMSQAIMEHTGRGATIISDPYEFARKPARGLKNPHHLQLLWFGHNINLPSLFDQLQSLNTLASRQKFSLEIVTGDAQKTRQALAPMLQMGLPIKLSFQSWSLETLEAAFDRADAVLVTTAGTPKFKAVKSPNRIIEPFWSGRMVIANPIDSYNPFREYAILHEDMGAGIQELLDLNADQVLKRIQDAQAYINQTHAPEVIGSQWARVFEGLEQGVLESTGGQNNPAVQRKIVAGEPVRLNLGCGDKILPGYINVDVVASRGGSEPDVLCDLRNLSSFADHMADEILSVHVVEHFWRWEVEDILKEWVRVLKPGGKLILECPNLLSACQTVLNEPDLATGPGPEGQFSMWVLYGDPSWKDPLMIHRWAYTPKSLAQLLHVCGLKDLRQEPAHFKQREPRDMRITGIKP